MLFGPLAHARHSCQPNARVTSVRRADIGEEIYVVKIIQAVEEGEELRVRWSATECDCLHCAAMFWPREPCDFCQAGDIVEGYVSPLRDVPLALEVEEAETDRESVPAAAPAARAARTPDHWLRCSHVEEIIHDM